MYLSSTKGNQRIASLAWPRWLYCLAAMLHHLATSRCWSTPKHAKSLHPPCPRRPVRDANPLSPLSTAPLGNHCSSGKEADSTGRSVGSSARQLAEAAGRDECRNTPIPRIAGSRSPWRWNGKSTEHSGTCLWELCVALWNQPAARAKLFPSALLPSAVTRDTTSRSIDCCHRPRSIWRPGAFPCFRQDVAHKGWPACIAHKTWSATHPSRSSLMKCLKFASRRLRRLSQLYAVAPAPQRQSRRWASKVLHHSFPSLWQESRWACGNLRCLQVLFSSRRQSDKRRYVRGTACAKKTPKHLPNIYSLCTVSYSVNFNYRRLNAIGKTADTEADS